MPPPPAVLVDTTSEFTSTPTPTTTTTTTAPPLRTLLLCPPSISSTPHILESALSTLSRDSTDVQMLDRLSLNLATLPEKTYNSVILLPSSSSTPDLNPAMFDRVFASMVPGAKWRSRDNLLGGCEKLVLLMAGFLVEQENGSTVLVKPDIAKSVPLRPRKRGDRNGVTAPPKVVDVPAPVVAVVASINGVGYVDYGDVADDEELIDEDDLGDDLAMPMQQPLECRPKPGKRRRACKDCTCGLREQLEEEDISQRSAADKALAAAKEKAAAGIKLSADDLAEIDFTVEGKASSCGSCYLGDAFRFVFSLSSARFLRKADFRVDVTIDMADDQL
ncbi:electron carrier [Maublancomyces gigas]|uniref:Electron carrier n=1 Tax=Discina gigas TaxID=1032678 RepID=A0ABR3G6A7_9PEZI